MGFVTEQHEQWKAKQDEDAGSHDPNYIIARDNADDTDPGAPIDQGGEPEAAQADAPVEEVPDPNTAGEQVTPPEGYEAGQ